MRNKLRVPEAESPGDKIQLWLIVLMELAFIVAIALSIYEGAWLTLFLSIIALITVSLPSLFAKNFQVHLPIEFEFILSIFIYSSLFLGEIHGFYTRFWWWDIVLHTGAGLALGFVGFLILYSLYQNKKIEASPLLVSVFSFSFAVAIGTVWEIFEFAMDSLLGFNMQKSGLVDTMWDLIVNASGAVIASFAGFILIRDRNNGKKIIELIEEYSDPKDM